MKINFGYAIPEFTPEKLEDSLFHYTTATGLIGILKNNELWFTAAYCSNDESELEVGQELLKKEFREATYELINSGDQRVKTFHSRGVDPIEQKYDEHFASLLVSLMFNSVTVFIACLCSATNQTEYQHGLLSQWRGYGTDGGYAIQFSKKKLIAQIEKSNVPSMTTLSLQQVNYSEKNEFQVKLQKHLGAFRQAYLDHLTILAQPLSNQKDEFVNPLKKLVGEPLSALLDYLVFTKNHHFKEELEWRLGQLRTFVGDEERKTVSFLNRNGLIIPYIKTEASNFDVLSCIDSIIVGPNSRMDARLQSTSQIVRSTGMKILVRPSGIPFTRT